MCNMTKHKLDKELPNSCYYTTRFALESQINEAIGLVKEEFDITIKPTYLNDGCSSSESLNTAIQRYLFEFIRFLTTL